MVGSCGSWSVFHVFINIALAGWNLRFTSLAAATRRCPTLSKATRFLRYVAMPSNVTREYSDIWASLYCFLLSGAGQYVFCSHSIPPSLKIKIERTERNTQKLSWLHDVKRHETWAWKSLENFIWTHLASGVYTTKESNHGKPVYKKAARRWRWEEIDFQIHSVDIQQTPFLVPTIFDRETLGESVEAWESRGLSRFFEKEMI